jgi:hypothetical protein
MPLPRLALPPTRTEPKDPGFTSGQPPVGMQQHRDGQYSLLQGS